MLRPVLTEFVGPAEASNNTCFGVRQHPGHGQYHLR